jgi:hypothetical protein
MHGFGIALLVIGSLVAIGMFEVLAKFSHASAARDDVGVRSILSISGALLVLFVSCWIGRFALLFRGRYGPRVTRRTPSVINHIATFNFDER